MKRSVGRLTEKRMANRKFRKNEEKILQVFCEENGCIYTGVIVRRAGVARSTFYRHHKNVGMIASDYKNYVLRKYRRMVRKLVKNNTSTRAIYVRTIYFILSQKWAFKLLMKSEGRVVFIDMISVIKPIIKKREKLFKNSEKILNVYIGEVAELIYSWSKGGMKREDSDKLVEDIMYLTNTIKLRLGKLEK